jgi:hypothetical protein
MNHTLTLLIYENIVEDVYYVLPSMLFFVCACGMGYGCGRHRAIARDGRDPNGMRRPLIDSSLHKV